MRSSSFFSLLALIPLALAKSCEPRSAEPQSISVVDSPIEAPASEFVQIPGGESVQTFPTGLLGNLAQCKAWPGTASWPSKLVWTALNITLGGNLIEAVPPYAVCHDSFEGKPTYDAQKCAEVAAASQGFGGQDWHYEHPISQVWDTWTNDTCPISTPKEAPCAIGAYPEYVVRALTPAHVQLAVKFAAIWNIRLVIKNTGHDFLGKSMGAGSLSIWTHNLKEVSHTNKYQVPGAGYTGSAITLGAGWQTRQIYEYVNKLGKVVVGGECAGVGMTGGYIQGGGHGPLVPSFGLASDHVLQYKVVNAQGQLLTVSKTSNPDLYWAMRGGGASTWGVVTSVTVKTYNDFSVVSGVSLYFDTATNGADKFWKGVEAFHAQAPFYISKNVYVGYMIRGGALIVQPILAVGKTAAETQTIIQPLLTQLTALGITYTHKISSHPNFLAAYNALFDGEPAGGRLFVNSRFVQKRHVDTPAANAKITQWYREMADAGVDLVCQFDGPPPNLPPQGAANPQWANTVILPLFSVWVGGFTGGPTTEATRKASIDQLTNIWEPKSRLAAPGSGAYLNEGNPYNPQWKEDYYGVNYARLLRIKKQVDPTGVFYAATAVGSDEWKEVTGGRLCRA